MKWLLILGISLFLILLFCMTRVGADVRSNADGVGVDIRFGLFRFHVIPGKEKKTAPEEDRKRTEKAARAAARKAARRAERKAQKDARRGEKLTVRTQRLREILADLQSAVNALWPPLKRALERTRKGVRIHPLQLSVTVGGQKDPADAAQIYGYLHGAVWSIMPALEKVLNIPSPYIHVGVDFDTPDTCFEGEVGISVRIGTLIAVAFGVGVPALRWFLKWNKQKNKQRQEMIPAGSDITQKG